MVTVPARPAKGCGQAPATPIERGVTMLSEFGKELRKLRIDHGKTLGDLGEELGVSAAFISALERGKPVPLDFIGKVISALNLNPTEARRLEAAAARQANEVVVSMAGKDDRTKELTLAFARKLDHMSVEELQKLLGDE